MIKVLILEDNLKALEIISQGLRELETELGKLDVMTFSEGRLADEFLGKFDCEKFDVVLLDYLSGDDQNFHQAILGRINPEKIIAISNTIDYNRMAEEKGVLRSVQKNYFDLIDFKNELKKEIKNNLKI
jgi:predicted O-methyltransferase YrrM